MSATTAPSSASKYDTYDFPTQVDTTKTGYPGHLTPEQEAQVVQLRTALEQAGYTERLDTLTLLRFLRARKFNVELTKQMYIKRETWRKEYNGGQGLDHVLETFDFSKERAQLATIYPQYYHQTDKDGRPIYIEKLGKAVPSEMYKLTTQDRLLTNMVVEYEKVADPRLPACSRMSGKLLETCCTIMDLKGMSLFNMKSTVGYVQAASEISQNYYPERLGKLYIINAPWGFSSLFSVASSFLDPVTVEKIHVLGSHYQPELLKQIGPQNLPKEFGGSCECPGGCANSDKGPWHESQYTVKPDWLKKREAAGLEPKDEAIENSTTAPVTVTA